MKNDPNTPGKKIADFWETSQKEVLSDPKKLLDRLFEFDKLGFLTTVQLERT